MPPFCLPSFCCREALLFKSFRLRRGSKLMPLISSHAVWVAMSTSQSCGATEGGGVGSRGTSASSLEGSSLARYTRTDSTSGSAKLICFGGDGSLSGERADIVIQSPFGWNEPDQWTNCHSIRTRMLIDSTSRCSYATDRKPERRPRVQ